MRNLRQACCYFDSERSLIRMGYHIIVINRIASTVASPQGAFTANSIAWTGRRFALKVAEQTPAQPHNSTALQRNHPGTVGISHLKSHRLGRAFGSRAHRHGSEMPFGPSC